MHAAPPVRVMIGRSLGWVVLLSVCVGIATANVAAWALLRNDAPSGPAAAAGAFAAVLCAWQLWRSAVAGDLLWTGADWQWQGRSGHVELMLDLGVWLLLRFDSSQGTRRWIVASRASSVGPWAALRAALYARRPADPLAP